MGKLLSHTLKTFTKFITGAFSLIAALAWNAAIQNSLSELSSVGGPYVYAVLVTLLASGVVVAMSSVAERVTSRESTVVGGSKHAA